MWNREKESPVNELYNKRKNEKEINNGQDQ